MTLQSRRPGTPYRPFGSMSWDTIRSERAPSRSSTRASRDVIYRGTAVSCRIGGLIGAVVRCAVEEEFEDVVEEVRRCGSRVELVLHA